MSEGPVSGRVDTRAIADLANGFAVVGYALFAFQQAGEVDALRAIQPVDRDTPIAELIQARYAGTPPQPSSPAPYAPEPANVPVDAAGGYVQDVPVEASEGLPEAVSEHVPVSVPDITAAGRRPVQDDLASYPPPPVDAAPYGDPNAEVAPIEFEFSDVEQAPSAVLTPPTIPAPAEHRGPDSLWDQNLWRTAAEKNADRRQVVAPAPEPAPEPTPPPVVEQAPEPQAEGGYGYGAQPGERSKVRVLQELSFLDE